MGQSRHLLSSQYPMTGAGVSKPPTAGRARKRTFVPSFGAPTSFGFHTLFMCFSILPPCAAPHVDATSQFRKALTTRTVWPGE